MSSLFHPRNDRTHTDYVLMLGKHSASANPVACHEQRFRLRKTVIHPRFDARRLVYDIALAWIETEYNQTAMFSPHVQPACLPPEEEASLYESGEVGTASGWGLTDEGDSGSAATALQYVQVDKN